MQIRKSPALKIQAHWNDESQLKTVRESNLATWNYTYFLLLFLIGFHRFNVFEFSEPHSS